MHGVNSVQPEDGAFGEYLVTKDGVQVKIPENVSDEDAATLGVGITTIGQGLYQSLGLPLPDAPSKEKTPVLIYGGRYVLHLLMGFVTYLLTLPALPPACSRSNGPSCKSP